PLGLPVPTLKIASNTPLARRKPTWIDFDSGVLVGGAIGDDGSARGGDGGGNGGGGSGAADAPSPDEVADRLFDLCLDVASGRRRARNEINGNREIAIWKDGVTL
ncbi:MAG: D-galactarate dehydratase/Altronate hydrolase domain protein, partial [Phycisphaerales bacterium]|nr:D-galactarate dehydratase/Altronate hydrolase domain protein [Phycisphaerales bacterium]